MLRCADGSYYTGQSQNLEERVDHHQRGVVRGYTYTRRPIELVWSEAFEERSQAMEAERILKGWSRAKKEAFLAGNWKRVSQFAVPPEERPARRAFPERSRGTTPSEVEVPHNVSDAPAESVLDFARTSPSTSLGKKGLVLR